MGIRYRRSLSTPPVLRSFRSAKTCTRWESTTSGAITAPKARRLKSRKLRIARDSKRFNGAAACTRRSGGFQNCAMGHKWLWNRQLGGLPPESFLAKVDPLLQGVRAKLDGEYATSDQIAGT